jgi:hypothetical protein
MPDQPVAHLPRAVPPWDEIRYTHCGRLIVDVAKMGTAEAYAALVKRQGQRRAAYDYCQNCTERAKYTQGSWETNATDIALDWLGRTRYISDGGRDIATATLHALAALVDAHREEFEAHRDATKSGIASLNAKRTAKNMPHLRGLV